MQKGLLVNGVGLAILAAGVAVFSFFKAPAEGISVSEGWITEGEFVFDQIQTPTTSATARLNGRDSVSLLSGSTGAVHYDEETKTVTVDLMKGGVLFSTLADDFEVEVKLPFARVNSQHSMAYVDLDEDGQNLNVYAVTHPSLVTFVSDGIDLNALNVPGSYRMKVPASKVTDVLGKLRLTKLTKEFPVFGIADEDLDQELNEVLTATSAAYADSAAAFLSGLQSTSDYGPSLSGFGGEIYDAYGSFRDALTVLPTAELHLQELRKQNALVYAMSNYLYGDAAAAAFWLSEWTSYGQDTKDIQKLYSEMFFVLPGDALYPVKAAAAQILYPHEDPIRSLRRQYAQIESLLDRASQVDAQEAYLDYQALLEMSLGSGAFDDPKSLPDISREYHLLELMLRSNAVFYTVNSTASLSSLEEKILALVGSSQDLDEERQAFVQSKLRFLSNLFTFVEEKKVSVEEGTALAKELIYEATDLMGDITAQVAVTAYFKTQLEQASLSVQFMNAPEFYSYDSFEEGLAAYQAKQADLAELNAYIQSIRSGMDEGSTMSLEDATQVVEDDLVIHAIQFSAVLSLGDASNRLFEIEGARTSGYAFQAKYDRETRILYDVVVGELRFSTGLNLDDARDVIQAAVQNQSDEASSEVNAPDSTSNLGDATSLTETVALNVVRSQFEKSGLNPDDFVFTVVDLAHNTFSFEGTMTAAGIPVSGSYNASTQVVSELVWQFSSAPQTLDDMPLLDFESNLEQAYQLASQAE